MPKPVVAGNWKMNMTLPEASSFMMDLKAKLQDQPTLNSSVVVLPPFPLIASMAEEARGSVIEIGAQNCHQARDGAYTGEVSAPILTSSGAKYVIIGHSERRQYFQDAGSVLGHKIDMAMHYGLTPIYCCGEDEEQRNKGDSEKVVRQQIENELFHLEKQDVASIIIGYEPVWAIGTGQNASPDQAEGMHATIRELLRKKYDKDTAEAVPIIYGGSVKPGNAGDLFHQPNINGGLIGGASLNPDNLMEIIKAGG